MCGCNQRNRTTATITNKQPQLPEIPEGKEWVEIEYLGNSTGSQTYTYSIVYQFSQRRNRGYVLPTDVKSFLQITNNGSKQFRLVNNDKENKVIKAADNISILDDGAIHHDGDLPIPDAIRGPSDSVIGTSDNVVGVETTGIVRDIIAAPKNYKIADIIKQLNSFSREDLETLLENERNSNRPRKLLLTALNKRIKESS